jgi:AraC-like DNA-binding protein
VTCFRRIHRLPLARFVEFFWLAEGYVQPHAAERVLPTGCVDLILSLDARREADVLAGPRSRSIILDTSRALSFIGVRFRPGGAFPFLGLPIGELQDISVEPAALWGAPARTLRDQLLHTPAPEARFDILERFLLERLHEARDRHPAVQYAIQTIGESHGAASVASIVEHTGLSARRFIAAFRSEVGLVPKVFCRLARFRRVIGELRDAEAVDWADLALDCGYFDQSHFIHDFRAFAGVSPSAYLRQRTSSANHLRIAEVRRG